MKKEDLILWSKFAYSKIDLVRWFHKRVDPLSPKLIKTTVYPHNLRSGAKVKDERRTKNEVLRTFKKVMKDSVVIDDCWRTGVARRMFLFDSA